MIKLSLDFLYCLLLSIFILVGVHLVPLHGDESTQIFMGRDFYYLLNGQSVAFQDWDTLSGEEATEQQLRLLNGTLPKYLFGLSAYFMGYEFEDINQQWEWGSGWDWNHQNGHVPDERLIIASRLVSSVLLAISAIALFGIGYQITGRGTAYLAAFVYVMNPAVLLNGRRAMMEGSMPAFTILAILVALYLLKYRSWWLFLLLGMVNGLAIASKHTSVVTIAAIFFACGSYFLWRNWKHQEDFIKPISSLFATGIITLLIFFGLNPAWWNSPIGAAQTVLELRQNLLNEQVSFFGGYKSPLHQSLGFLRQVFAVPPMYSETDMDGFLSEQSDIIYKYETSLLAGVSLDKFGFISLAFLALGLFYLGRKLFSRDSSVHASAWLIFIWFFAMIVLTLFLTPLEWQRYYLPIYPPLALLMGLGLDRSFLWFKNAYDKQRIAKSA